MRLLTEPAFLLDREQRLADLIGGRTGRQDSLDDHRIDVTEQPADIIRGSGIRSHGLQHLHAAIQPWRGLDVVRNGSGDHVARFRLTRAYARKLIANK
jgi:hypothetical protein